MATSQTLYDLNGSGAYRPWGSVTQGQGTDTSLYGTTSIGGTSGIGIIYKLTLEGAFTLLHSFDGSLTSFTNIEGAQPVGGLVAASDGLLWSKRISRGKRRWYGLHGSKGRLLPSEDIRLSRSRKLVGWRTLGNPHAAHQWDPLWP